MTRATMAWLTSTTVCPACASRSSSRPAATRSATPDRLAAPRLGERDVPGAGEAPLPDPDRLPMPYDEEPQRAHNPRILARFAPPRAPKAADCKGSGFGAGWGRRVDATRSLRVRTDAFAHDGAQPQRIMRTRAAWSRDPCAPTQPPDPRARAG